MTSPGKDEDDIAAYKAQLAEKRNRQQKKEEAQAENEIIQAKCFQLADNINYEKKKKEALIQEVQYRKQQYEQVKNDHIAITDHGTRNIKNQVNELKNKIVSDKLKDLLNQKMPELQLDILKQNQKALDNTNDFKGIIHKYIQVTYTHYDTPTSKEKHEECQTFRISNKSKFSTLRRTACQYFSLPNDMDYLLTDEAEAVIYYEDMIINDYMRDYSALLGQLRLMYVPLLKARTKVNLIQESRMKECNNFGSKDKKKKDEGTSHFDFDSSHQKIKEFFTQEYTGLDPFRLSSSKRKPAEGATVNQVYLRARKWETSFIMLALIIIFFALNIYFIYQPGRDIMRNNLQVNYAKYYFDHSSVNSYTSFFSYLVTTFGLTFTNISLDSNAIEMDDTKMPYLRDVETTLNWSFLFQTNYTSGSNDTIAVNVTRLVEVVKQHRKQACAFQLMSSIHVIHSRVILATCSTSPVVKKLVEIGTKCYEMINTPTTTLKESLQGYMSKSLMNNQLQVLNDWISSMLEYKTNSAAQVELDISTLSGDYDGGGYHFDIAMPSTGFMNLIKALVKIIPLQNTFATAALSSSQKYLLENYFFVDRYVRNNMFLFTLYYPNENTWLSCVVSFDFLPTGLIAPSYSSFQVFQPNILSEGLLMADIIRLIIIIVFILFMALDYKEKKTKKKVIYRIFSFKTLINSAILVFFLIAFIMKLKYCYVDETVFYNSQGMTYYDTFSMAQAYNQIFFVECLLFGIVSIKFISILRISDYINLFFKSISLALSIFLKYSIFFISILLAYSCVSYILWGPYLREFQSFGTSFLQILLFSLGYINVEELARNISGWAVTFLFTFFLFVLFFMFVIFISIYAESLRRTVKKIGYAEDHKIEQWSIRDYAVWFCHYFGNEKKNEENN